MKAKYLVPSISFGTISWISHVIFVLFREKRYQYELFKQTYFSDTLKPNKPYVLFLGPFSAGKSTFINYLLGHDCLWTGPQPTTDKFTIIMHGTEESKISGRILTSNPDLPFRGLAEFGNQFLETLEGIQVPSDLLKNVSLIDTPGVLESAKEVHSRTYDYIKVTRWFIERADLVFVLFDPSKLDAGSHIFGSYIRGGVLLLMVASQQKHASDSHLATIGRG